MIRPHDSLLVRTVVKYLTPFIQVYALYILFHGHASPGGAFQGGVLLGASLVLAELVGKTGSHPRYHIRGEYLLASLGILIYAGAGIAAMVESKNFLDYSAISLLGHELPVRRYFGILTVEIGVALAIAMTIVMIFRILAHAEETGRENVS